MSPPHSPILLLLTTFSALLPLVFTGGLPSPRDFDDECSNNVGAEDSQQPFADLDRYDDLNNTQSFNLVSATRVHGMCMYVHCIYSATALI